MSARVFANKEPEELYISTELFKIRPLPSKKAMAFQDLYGSNLDIKKVLGEITSEINEDTSDMETLSVVGKKLFDIRYAVIAKGLEIERDSEDFERLKKAIDEASFREIFWVIDQILEINGFKIVEKMIKNLLVSTKEYLPSKETIQASLKKFSEESQTVKNLKERLEDLRSNGSTSSSSDSVGNPSTLVPPTFFKN